MNPKIANLIAIETGILVGLMSWLTYSSFPSAEPRTATEVRESRLPPVTAVAPVNSVAPAFAASNQRPSTTEYSAEREQARLMAERSASLQSYYRQVAAESYARSGVENASVPVDSPSYSEVNQEPAVVPAEYQAPVIYYAPPITTVVVSNSRPFGNRCRPAQRLNGTPGPITNRCPDRTNPHVNDPRMVPGPNVSAPPRPPVQGPRPPGVVSQTVATGGGQQKRVGVPASSGTSRRLVP